MKNHYQVWFLANGDKSGKLVSTHLTRGGATSQIGKLVLKGWTGKFELREGCYNG